MGQGEELEGSGGLLHEGHHADSSHIYQGHCAYATDGVEQADHMHTQHGFWWLPAEKEQVL